MERRILRIDSTGIAVAQAARFESEQRLHDAVAAHPEVLPHEDFGLLPLIALATELDLGSGPMDLLAADSQGRLVIVEFKRGTENPDVRQVVAQILDYGASLWRFGYTQLEEECLKQSPEPAGSLVELAAGRLEALGQPFDEDAFRTGVEAALESGAFIFVYCGRNLDERTRRIMTYLAEGPRMTFFAVEVDYFREGTSDNAVLVPRTAFIPSWITAPEAGDGSSRRPKPSIANAPAEFHEMVARMDEVAREMGLQVSRRRTGWNYLPPVLEEGIQYPQYGIGVYATSRGVEFYMQALAEFGRQELAETLLARLGEFAGIHIPPDRKWPAVPYSALLHDWPRARADVIEPYFRARMDGAGRGAVAGSSTAQELRDTRDVS